MPHPARFPPPASSFDDASAYDDYWSQWRADHEAEAQLADDACSEPRDGSAD